MGTLLEKRRSLIMKVKLITGDTTNQLELSINSFIKDKNIIDIKYSVVPYEFHNKPVFKYSVIIMYLDE